MKVQVNLNHNLFIKFSFTLSDESSLVTKLNHEIVLKLIGDFTACSISSHRAH